MASVSNAFSLLTGGQDVAGSKKKNRKRSKKKTGPADPTSQPSGESPHPAATASPAPPEAAAPAGQDAAAPTTSQLESKAKKATTAHGMTELITAWTLDLANEKGFVGRDGRMVSFHSILVESRAIEACVEACVSLGDAKGLEEALFRFLEEALKATEPKVITQLLVAVAKVEKTVRSRGGEMLSAGKRAVRDLTTALKKADKVQMEQERGKWKGGNKQHKPKRSAVPERKPGRGESKVDYDLSMASDELKVRLADLDEVGEQMFGGGEQGFKSITSGASQGIAHLKLLMSMAKQQDDGFSDVPRKGKKGKGGGGGQTQTQTQAPKKGLMDHYNKEAMELQEQEMSLLSDITALETRLNSLRSQLMAIKDAQEQLENRKSSAVSSKASSSGVPLIPQKQQDDLVGSLESVVSELTAMSSMMSDEDDAFVSAYVIACKKVLNACLAKQDEVLKNVKFLQEALQRKRQHEEQLLGMAVGSSRKELLVSNRKHREGLEQQLQDARTVALNLLKKADKISNDAVIRSELLGRGTTQELEDVVVQVRANHAEIVKESTIIKRPAPQAAPVPTPTPAVQSAPPRKKFDASQIIKEATMEMEKERQQNARGRQDGAHGQQGAPQRPSQGQEPCQQQATAVATASPPQQGGPTPAVKQHQAPPAAAPVTIPSVEDEMVPPPNAVRSESNFSPIGNGTHLSASKQVAPIAPQPQTQTQLQNPNPIAASQPRQPYAPRGWKKINQAPVADVGGAPTPAEAREMEMKGGK